MAPAPLVRLARLDEVDALNALIPESARELGRGFYSPEELDAAARHVFGVDTRLIEDGTYFVVEQDGMPIACGGWSARRTLYGGDQRKSGPGEAGELDNRLDPAVDAARIRAFFVGPRHARRGLGRLLLATCEAAARAAGFRTLELMATLPGVPFYAACGFEAHGERRDRLPSGVEVRFVPMQKVLACAGRPPGGEPGA